MIALWTLACRPQPTLLPPPPPGPPYPQLLARIEATRTTASAEDAPEAFDRAIVDLIDAWHATPWDFHGTARTPGDDPIACGHFVAGILADAGLRVDRLPLGQQAAEHIITTVVPPTDVRRYRREPVDQVLANVVADGPGVYLVGLDTHVGFLVHLEDRPMGFCHSSAMAGAVVCEDPRLSPTLPSRYTVVGRLGRSELIAAWRGGRALKTDGLDR